MYPCIMPVPDPGFGGGLGCYGEVWGVSMDRTRVMLTVQRTLNLQTSLPRTIGSPTDSRTVLLPLYVNPRNLVPCALFGSAYKIALARHKGSVKSEFDV